MTARSIAILAALMSIAAPLSAETMDGMPRDSEKAARASAHRAKVAFDLGRFSDALAGYEAAYQAMQLPALLFDIAQCHRNLKHYEEARFLYRRYLALDPRSEDRPVIEGLIAEMTRKIGDESAHPAAVSPGLSSTTQGPSFKPVTAVLGVAGASSAVPVLQRNDVWVPAAPVHVQSSDVTDRSEPRPLYRRWWFWTGIGVLVAGAITAGMVFTTHSQQAPPGTLPAINGRSGP